METIAFDQQRILSKKTIRRRIIPPNLADNFPESLHPLLRRVYRARNLTHTGQLDLSLKNLLPLDELYGLTAATDLLVTALQKQERIVIVADFDADGATACAVAVRALRAMGAQQVDYVIPNRMIHGYGLTPAIVAVAAERAPNLLITVDNGISNSDGVAAAQARGIKVLITDHHLPGKDIPSADAIVNPNCPDNRFSSKCLAGVGVIFYVMLALRARLRAQGWFNAALPEPNLGNLLDLVALGTVADVVPLDYNNRILVAQGLTRIRSGAMCPGMAALLEIAGRIPAAMQTMDLGFFIGPRLNAAGRLKDMTIGVECLLSDDPRRARELAMRLDKLNRERRAIEEQMQDQAFEELARLDMAEFPWGVVLYDAGWHPGVIGILAARIKDRCHRPVIAFAPSATPGEIRGSVRSIPGVHARDTLEAIASSKPGLIQYFGGHAAAAGLTIPYSRLAEFSASFESQVQQRLSPEQLAGVIPSDGELSPEELTIEVAELIRNGGPWGQHFPEPSFDGIFQCLDSRVVGEIHLKLSVRSNPTMPPISAIVFKGLINYLFPQPGSTLHLVYRLDVHQYQNNRSLQLLIEYFEIL